MVIKFKKVALFLVLSLAAVSCEKETFRDSTVFMEETVASRTVVYSIDGVTRQMTVLGESSWNSFLDWMFALAEEGHVVSFRLGDSSQNVSSKETVTFTTTNKNEAFAWADAMVESGYSVTVQYDDKTGIYTCTAIK